MKVMNKVKIFRAVMPAFMVMSAASTVHAVDFEAGSTSVSLYGNARLDVIHDLDSNLGPGSSHSNIRLDDEQGPTGHTNLQYYSSQMGFKTSTPTERGDLKTMIEWDFWPSGGFRLRHAYGEWNGITAGQTWSNFGSLIGHTPSLNYNGMLGQANISRQAQIRYTTGGFSVSLEDPGTLGGTVDSGTFVGADDSLKNSLPDLAVRYTARNSDFSYGVSGLLRRVEYYEAATDSDVGATGWGVNFEGAYNFSDDFTLRGAVTYGDGLGGYLYQSPGRAGYVNSKGDVETVKSIGGTVGASYKIGQGALNAAVGLTSADLDNLVAAGDVSSDSTDEHFSAQLNYIWSPIKNVVYGVEVGYHSKETVNGREGDAVRLQGMVRYNF